MPPTTDVKPDIKSEPITPIKMKFKHSDLHIDAKHNDREKKRSHEAAAAESDSDDDVPLAKK